MTINKPIVFDSWAVLSFLQKEKSHSKIEEIIQDAFSKEIELYIHSVNLGEVWYILAKKVGENRANLIIESLLDFGIQRIETNWSLTKKAASYKLLGGISYADCFAAATAFELGATLLTGDSEFERVQHEVEIVWFNS